MLKKILLLVAVGAVAFACKDVKPDPKPKPKPEPEPSVFKIAINVADGEQYTSQIDSVEAYYSTKEFNTVVLRRVPYNNGKFELELLDTIQNKDFQTIVEYYALKSVTRRVCKRCYNTDSPHRNKMSQRRQNNGILHHPSIYGRGSRPLFRQILLLR
mgnify:FL=1